MILRALLISGLVLVFFSGCSEATKAQVAPKAVQTKTYKLKVTRVEKKPDIVLNGGIIAKNNEVFEIDYKTLKTLTAQKNIKKNSVEDNVLKLIDSLGIDKSLSLKTINHGIKGSRDNKHEIVVYGHEHNSYGYLVYFNKETFDVNKILLFKNKKVWNISNDMKQVIVVERKNSKNHIKLYDIENDILSDFISTKNKIEKIEFSPKDNYIVAVVNFEVGNKPAASIGVFDVKTAKRLSAETAYSDTTSGVEFNFAFSPDEKYIFFSRHYKEKGYIYWINADILNTMK